MKWAELSVGDFMYLGPLKSPTRSVWMGAICVTVAAVDLGHVDRAIS